MAAALIASAGAIVAASVVLCANQQVRPDHHVRRLRQLLPYFIPKDNIKVQLCLAVCMVCTACERFLNVLIPRQVGIVADTIASGSFPYRQLGKYALLSLMHNESGLGLVLSLARTPVRAYMSRRLKNMAFTHAMSLSAEFHATTATGELMVAIEQGDALTQIAECLVLDVGPTIVDTCVALAVLNARFDLYVSLYLMSASVVFVFLESTTSNWATGPRRAIADEQKSEARAMREALQAWPTVTLFNMLDFERHRVGQAVEARLAAQGEWERVNTLTMGFRQSMVPIFFFVLASLVVRRGNLSAGDFVFLVQYWEYLIWPIKLLSHSYRRLVSLLVDAERLLDLLDTKPDVIDAPSAATLESSGVIEFKNVSFAYDSARPLLCGVNFCVRPGQTVALVGATGSGKSTVVKLLLRLYDTKDGSVSIDGHDVRDVTSSSLRDLVAVVPQHPRLFHASVMDNIRYAKMESLPDKVCTACRAASIHDDIIAMSHGYDTNVGENGAKLSGGEVQRLAIARALLKDTPVLVLDEATSSVDAATEAKIYAALTALRQGLTTIIVAHRLAAIIDADEILVFDKGEIVQRGKHAKLVGQPGVYQAMWHANPQLNRNDL